MFRADFRVINFNSHLGDKQDDLVGGERFTFQGSETPVRTFWIDNRPVDRAYIILQAFNVGNRFHKVFINGEDLAEPPSDFFIPEVDEGDVARSWQTWMDTFDGSILRRGENAIQIKKAATERAGQDNFFIGEVVISWREIVADEWEMPRRMRL